MTRGLHRVGRLEMLGYRPGRPKRAVVIPTPEEIKRRTAENERFVQRMLAEMEANRGLGLVKNQEARMAVEGNTDLNHDNVEADE